MLTLLSASFVCQSDKLLHFSGTKFIFMIKNLSVHGNMDIFYIQCRNPVFIDILLNCKVRKEGKSLIQLQHVDNKCSITDLKNR